MPAKDLFPEIEPFDKGFLQLSPLHRMYYEQCGNAKGVPVVFLHGGPGAGANATHRRFFDPAFYRIIIFDQRGSGRSQPLGETRDNTTPHLIADMELLREHLGVDRWFVFGGSWGSTLALAYAEHHPERVRGLALRGIFLCRKSEIQWFLYGLREFAPEAWRAFAGHIPEAERGDLLEAYWKRLMDPNPSVHLPAARAWSVYEGSCSTLLPSPETVRAFSADTLALGLARMEAHYFRNDIFLPRGFPHRQRRSRAADPDPDRAGPLRSGVPDPQRRRSDPRLARGALRHRAGRRPLRHGNRHPHGAGGGHGSVQDA